MLRVLHIKFQKTVLEWDSCLATFFFLYLFFCLFLILVLVHSLPSKQKEKV